MGIKMGHVGRAVSHKINHILRALSLEGTAQLRYVHVVAKVNWRLMYTLAPNFEANVYISPKLQTWRLMCTLAPNFEANVYIQTWRLKFLPNLT